MKPISIETNLTYAIVKGTSLDQLWEVRRALPMASVNIMGGTHCNYLTVTYNYERVDLNSETVDQVLTENGILKYTRD